MTFGSPAEGDVVGAVVGAAVGALDGSVVGDVDGDVVEGDVVDDVSSVLGAGALVVAGAPVPAHGFAGAASSLVEDDGVLAFTVGTDGPEPSCGFFSIGRVSVAGAFVAGAGGVAGFSTAGADSVTSMSSCVVVIGFPFGSITTPSRAGGGVITVVSMRPFVTSVRETGSILPSSLGGAVPLHCGRSPLL